MATYGIASHRTWIYFYSFYLLFYSEVSFVLRFVTLARYPFTQHPCWHMHIHCFHWSIHAVVTATSSLRQLLQVPCWASHGLHCSIHTDATSILKQTVLTTQKQLCVTDLQWFLLKGSWLMLLHSVPLTKDWSWGEGRWNLNAGGTRHSPGVGKQRQGCC